MDDLGNELPVGKVVVGSRIRIRTGARVPLDARVVSGSESLDQAPITGESLPVDKQIGDVMFAGSIVTDGVIEAIVTVIAGESTLTRIAKAIQEAQSQRVPTQRFVDQFAHYYTPAVVALAAGVAIFGPLLMGGTWSSWLYEALVLLIIAFPCALVISTPITVVSGLASGARQGILIKGGVHLEGGRLLKVIALDKTGTLTQGKPILTDVISIADIPSDEDLLIAASLDDNSTHPVAKALILGWKTAQPPAKTIVVEAFAVLNGQGVKGNINGQEWHLGNHRLIEEIGFCSTQLEARLVTLEHQGKTVIILCNSEHPIAKLKALHVLPVMLTGDNLVTAQSIAEQRGILDALGNLLPKEK